MKLAPLAPRHPNLPPPTRAVPPAHIASAAGIAHLRPALRLSSLGRAPDARPPAVPEAEMLGVGAPIRPRVVRSYLLDRVTPIDIISSLTPNDPATYREQLVQGTELVMMQGVYCIHEISHLYGCTEEQAKAALAELRVRFTVSGGMLNVRAARGEMMEKLNFLEAKLWGEYKKALTVRDRSTITANLLGVLDRKSQLSGLTKEQIEMVLEVRGDSEVVSGMRRQQGVVDMFARICERVEEVQSREATGRTLEE